MPKMNGFELYKEMKKIDDRVKICFLTAIEFYYEEFIRVFPKLNMGCFTSCCTYTDNIYICRLGSHNIAAN